ncbi:hypothetical protein LTR85_011260 [Meristemomyces frigidus]|nr:hypothetical protein LTR85_011260 [Meristemomyces frigidus]
MAPLSILIIGCGVAGPILASFLLLGPHKPQDAPHITILERSSSPRAQGQNVDIRGVGVTIIRKLGLESAIRASTTGEEGAQFVDAQNRVWARFGADKSGKRQTGTSDIEIMRGRLAEIFYLRSQSVSEEVKGKGGAGIEYVFGDYAESITQDGAKVHVRFARSDEYRSFDLVVGADGLQSRTRRLAFGAEGEEDRLNRLGMYGAFWSMPKGSSDSLWRRWFNAPGGRGIMLRPSDKQHSDRTSVFMFVVNEEDERFRNVATAGNKGVEVQKALLTEYWAGAGWEMGRVLKEMNAAYDFYYDLVAQVKMETWSKGRVVLLGDAGYCASPISGMGTTLALTGAYNLAGALLQHPNIHTAAFAAYEREMRPTVDLAQRLPMGRRQPHIMAPQTAWAIWLRMGIFAAVRWSGLASLLAKLKGPPANEVVVKEYGFRELDDSQEGIALYTNWRQLPQAPGPLLAGLTGFWRAWYQYNGKLRVKLLELHRRHGPIVRYGVKSVSISDPSIIDVVYGSRADSYSVLIGISNGKEVASLVSTADEQRHGALRRSVANAFTPTAVLDYEPAIDKTIAELLELLSRKSHLDLSETILYYTMDATGRFAFGAPLGCLAAEADVGGSIAVIRQRFNHWGWWSSLPWLERLICRNPIAMRIKRAPSSMAAAAASKLQERAANPHDGSQQPDLLTRFLEASETYPEILDTRGVVGMLMSTISGAGDTTATAVTATLFYLLKNSKSLAKLLAELEQAEVTRPVPAYSQVSKLPYLDAVIKEGMRLCSSATWPIERKVPAGGATIAGMTFPVGTSVGVNVLALHLNPAVFGENASEYRPGRWLEADPEKLRAMGVAHMGFSRGRRVCLGQNIAVMQMKKLIPAVVMQSQMTLAESTAELEADYSPAVVCLKALNVIIGQRV